MSGEKILVIDDNAANLELTRFLLLNEGYEAETAMNAQEALAILEKFHPELILMDIRLPDMDGLALTRKLKADPSTRDIIIVALTAYDLQGDEQVALSAGCDRYITKPVDTRTFPDILRNYLDAMRLRRKTA
jgi:CheY-like chemotaxis protein